MRSYELPGARTGTRKPFALDAAHSNIAIRIAPRAGRGLTRAALLGGVWLGALAVVAPGAAHAVDGTWTGPGSEWTVGTNWSSTPTVPDNTATFTNNIGAPTSVTISGNAAINTIEFDAAAPAYSFTVQNGATFTINSGTINNSSFAPAFTVNAGAALTVGNSAFAEIGSLAGGGTVTIGPSDSSSLLSIVGPNSTTFSGTFAGAGTLELDNGTLTLTGLGSSIGGLNICNCDTNGLIISGGSLNVTDPGLGTVVEGGTLSVINGGTLQTTNLAVVISSAMLISGPGSTVTVNPAGMTEIGALAGPTSLTIANGGVLTSLGGAVIDSGSPIFASTVTVTGAGSTWNVGAGLAVGGGGTFGGPGILTISNGGAVNATGLVGVGDPTGNSTLTVTGAGSTLTVLSALLVGDTMCGCGLIGTLTIADGGVVNSPGFTGIATGSTLNLGIGGLAGAIVTPAIDNEGQIVANFTDTVALAADISGAGTLSKAGVGTLILTGNNSYAGGTTITGGFINFNSANSFGTGPITIDGGGLQWATGNTADISAQLTAFGAGGATFDTNGNNVTLASALSGPGGLTKVGAGTMTQSGINTYQGGTTINGGTLAVAADANLGAAAGGLAFGGGTLQFLAGFTTNRTVTLNAGGGTFDTNGNNATLAGTIGGAGALTKIGPGTLTLTGANAYAGGTTINAGTLAVAADANLGAAAGGLTFGGGTLQFLAGFTSNRAVTLNAGGGTFDTNGNAATLGGNIGGAGALSKVGTGVLTLTGNNSYSGGSVLNAGTLAVGSNTALGAGTLTFANATTLQAAANGLSLANAMTLNGSDTVDTQSNTLALAGVISGSGALTKIGGGALTLAGANTYSGGTTLAGGTLTLANNQALGTGALTTTGSVVDYANGVTIGNPIVIDSNTTQLQVTAGTATQAGVISELNGPRPLEKIGAGALVLTATNTYSGPTTISAGTLVVNGSIANSAVTVNAGAVLAGSGIVGATTILSGGMFSPGPVGSPGSITVAGNLAFQSGALYLVQVNPSTASSDIVTAGGSATLAGTVQAAFASGRYASRTYTILSAAGGLNGTTFNALTTSNLPAGFSANLSYSATDVILNLTAQLHAIPGGGLSINQTNVATALDNFFNAGGALPPAFVSIFGLTGANLGNALSALSGEPATGGQQAGFQMTNQFLGLMLDPFVDGRTGVAGAGGPALGFAPEREALPEDIALAYSAVLKAPAKPPSFEQRWTAWGGAYGGGNRTSGDPAVLGSHDLSARTAGFAGGLDYRVAPNSVVGVALAGGGTNWSLSQGLGGGKSDAFQAGVYGATHWGPAYLAAAFAYTNHWMSTDRFAFAGDHLTASFNAQSLGGRVEGGYRFGMMFGGITPYAAIQAQSFRTPSYSETDTNGGGFALAYAGRTATDTRSELGARFDRLLAVNPSAALALRARLAWAHDWVSDPALAAVFQTLPGASFIVNGATPAKDSALASAGAELRLANGVTLLGKFDGEFAGRSSTYAGTGTVRYAW